MEGQIPDEAKSDHARLALIELPVMDEHGNPKTPETPTGENDSQCDIREVAKFAYEKRET